MSDTEQEPIEGEEQEGAETAPDGEPEPETEEEDAQEGEEQDGEQGAPEPTEEEPQQASGVSEAEMERRFGKAEKAAAAYARRISDIYEEDVVDLVECPLCPSIHKAFVNINDAGRVPDDVKQSVLAFLGFATEVEYPASRTFHTCQACDGLGKVTTGSKVAGKEQIVCPDCKGYGYIGPAGAATNGGGDHEQVMTGPLYVDDPGEPADTDPSGEPRLLPDGRENPNFGKWPQFKIPVPPWGTTAGLTVQDAVTAS